MLFSKRYIQSVWLEGVNIVSLDILVVISMCMNPPPRNGSPPCLGTPCSETNYGLEKPATPKLMNFQKIFKGGLGDYLSSHLVSPKMGGEGQGPFETFLKVHPFWRSGVSLS